MFVSFWPHEVEQFADSIRSGYQCSCRGGEAVVLLPQSEYAARLIRVLWRQHGVRSIAVSRNWRDRFIFESRFPVLRSQAVSASYVLGTRSIEQLAETLRRRHHVVAVIPHHEATVLPMTQLAAELGLSWAQPDVMPLFRDKAGFKARLRRVDPGLRLTRSQRVSRADEVLALMAEWDVPRVVVKPNDGSGNTSVRFFDRPATKAEVAAHLRRIGGPAVVEEFVGGEEFYVNGQMDHLGTPHILSAHRYDKTAVNGKPNVSIGASSLPRDGRLYQQLAAYAARVMRASGARRIPFHLEVKIDDEGPSLIEVAARMVGFGAATLDTHLSGVNVYNLAAHYYLHDSEFPARPVPANSPTRHSAAVLGVSQSAGRMRDITGVVEAEKLPGFLFWAIRPEAGRRVAPTVDLETTPWAAFLLGDSSESVRADAEALRRLIRWQVDGNRTWQGVVESSRRVWRARPRGFMLRTRPLTPRLPIRNGSGDRPLTYSSPTTERAGSPTTLRRSRAA